MVQQLLPRTIDNNYRGQKLALWLLGLVVFMKLGMGTSVVFNGRAALIGADGVPVNTFPEGAAQTVIAMFAVWGVSQFVLGLLGAITLVRYRAMVPLMFALLLLEHVARRSVLMFIPPVRVGTPPGTWVNIGLLLVLLNGFALSMWRRREV
jgi:hypothetical protein